MQRSRSWLIRGEWGLEKQQEEVFVLPESWKDELVGPFGFDTCFDKV